MSLHQLLKNLVPVNGIYKRLTHPCIRKIGRLNKYGLIGNRGPVDHVHIFKRLYTLIVLLRNRRHGVVSQINLAGLQSRIDLTGIHDPEIQLLNPGRTSPVLGISRIRNVVIHIIIRHSIRAAHHIRVIKPVKSLQLLLAVLL